MRGESVPIEPMPLTDEELKRRVVAARVLRGLTQTELGELFEADGLGLHDPGRIERGNMTMQRAHREAFIRLLRVPAAWFIEEDVDVIVGLKPARPLTPEASRDLLQQLLAGHDQAADQERQGTQKPQDDEGHQGPATGAGGA